MSFFAKIVRIVHSNEGGLKIKPISYIMTAAHHRIFLLNGWSKSGKDTCADYLVEVHQFRKFSFAEAAKIQVSKEYQFPYELTQTQEGKDTFLPEHNKTVRQLVIEYANAMRAKTPDVWAKIIATEIQAQKISATKPINFVISDWRLLDELLSLQRELYNQNITIIPIHIVRPSQLISPVPDTTEYSLLGFPFQYTITNPGTSEYFYRIQIMKILCEFLRNELPPPTNTVSYYA